MNAKDAKLLLDTLFDPGDRVQIRVLHETAKKAVHNRLYDSPTQALRYLVANRDYYAANTLYPCFGINPRGPDGRLAAIKNVVVDIDDAPLPSWARDRADIICSRDDRHHHLYFCVQAMPVDASTRAEYAAIVKALLRLTGSREVCAHDPERIMRLPGFAHGKKGTPGPGYRIVYIRDHIQRIPLSEKFNWLKQTMPAQPSGPITRPAITTRREQKETSQERIIAYLKGVYLKRPIIPAGNGRSRELFFLGLDCHAWGIDLDAAIALGREITQARHAPPEDDKIVRHQITSAYRYRRGEFGDIRERVEGATEKQQLKELKKYEIISKARVELADWVYCHDAVRLIDRATGRVLTSRDQMTSFIASVLGQRIDLDELLAAQAIETVDRIDYAPDIPDQVFERDGLKYYNSYRPGPRGPKPDRKTAKRAVQMFKQHIKYITTSEKEAQTLLLYLAYAIQHPGRKISWAPLIITPKTGTGKSFFAVLLERLCGDHNVSPVLSHDLLSKYNDYLAEKLWVIAHEVETAEKDAMMRLKSLITEKRVRVEAKYARPYTTRNCANYIFLSNKIDAIKADREDRRLFVIYNNCDPRDQDYYDKLFKALDEGYEAIRDYLLSIDTSTFNPHARPPKTTGWEMLVRASESDITNYLTESEQEQLGVFSCKYFTLKDLMQDIVTNAGPSARYATNRALAVWLYSRGYTSREIYINGKHYRYWTKLSEEEFKAAVRQDMAKPASKGPTHILG